MHPTIPTLVDLDEWLCARLRAKSLVSEPLPNCGKSPKGMKTGDRRQPRNRERLGNNPPERPPRFSTLATGNLTGNENPPTARACLVCDKRHAVEKCEKFLAMNVNQRAQLGKEKRLCFSCFDSADHQSRTGS